MTIAKRFLLTLKEQKSFIKIMYSEANLYPDKARKVYTATGMSSGRRCPIISPRFRRRAFCGRSLRRPAPGCFSACSSHTSGPRSCCGNVTSRRRANWTAMSGRSWTSSSTDHEGKEIA